LLVLAIACPLAAAADETLLIQGRLSTQGGQAAPDGTYAMVVAFYETKTAVDAVYQDFATAVDVSNGVFRFEAGTNTPLAVGVFQNQSAQWLAVTVNGEPELPRQPLHPIAYALHAQSADALSCTGCVTAGNLATEILSPYAKLADLSDLLPKAGGTLTGTLDFGLNPTANLRLESAGAAPAACEAATQGMVYYNTTDSAFYGCATDEWVPLAAKAPAGPTPNSQENPGFSCKQLLADTPGLATAVYWLDTDGSGPQVPFQNYCDMTTAGGGWTLVTRIRKDDGAHFSKDGYATLTAPAQTTPAKLSDARINILRGDYAQSVFRMVCNGQVTYFQEDKVFYSTGGGGNAILRCSKSPDGPWHNSDAFGTHFGLNTWGEVPNCNYVIYYYGGGAAKGCYSGNSDNNDGALFVR